MPMFSIFLMLASILSLTSASSAHWHLHKRTNASLGQVYAYGTNFSGVPIFFANSIAYVGNLSEVNATGTYYDFTKDDDNHLIGTPMSSDTSNLTTAYLAINTTTGAQDPVILTQPSDTNGLDTTGFYQYGNILAWLSSAGELKLNWYVVKTDTIGVLALHWAASGNPYDVDGASAIVLKTVSAS